MNNLDNDSGLLPSMSYRNHFQQEMYSNSSLLKSIGRDEEDSGHINFIMQKGQFTDERYLFSGGEKEKKTPGLGGPEDTERSAGRYKSSAQRQDSGPFQLAGGANKNNSLSNITSTFKIEK